MPTEMYAVSAEDAPETVSRLLERDDVLSVRVEDIDGETLAEVPGTSTPEDGARELMSLWDDYEGGGTQLHVVAETSPAPDEPKQGRILGEPPEHPEEGEPRRHE